VVLSAISTLHRYLTRPPSYKTLNSGSFSSADGRTVCPQLWYSFKPFCRNSCYSMTEEQVLDGDAALSLLCQPGNPFTENLQYLWSVDGLPLFDIPFLRIWGAFRHAGTDVTSASEIINSLCFIQNFCLGQRK